ncbi:GGDEF domain-containing protein, partial [Deinococcus malanensis]|uniref:GGDEF domain-containing protein n=1 Tax=Deinococcus malanensis TaxID=1706855 RepID=UPI0016638882
MEKARHLAAIAIEHRRLTDRLHHQAQYDPLTKLPNRSLFTSRLSANLAMAETEGLPLAMLFIDLDDFKGVNDTLGHQAGDQLLTQAAQRLRDCVRVGDTLARLGGDEFTVILPFADEARALQVAQRILAAFSVPLTVAGRELFIGVSIGISAYPHGGRDPESLQRHADMAMYR